MINKGLDELWGRCQVVEMRTQLARRIRSSAAIYQLSLDWRNRPETPRLKALPQPRLVYCTNSVPMKTVLVF